MQYSGDWRVYTLAEGFQVRDSMIRTLPDLIPRLKQHRGLQHLSTSVASNTYISDGFALIICEVYCTVANT